MRLALPLVIALLAAPLQAQSPAPGVPEMYGKALAGLRARSEAKPVPAVAFRLGHLVNEDKVPDIPYSLIQNVGGGWAVLIPVQGRAKWYRKGDVVNGVRLTDVNRNGIACEFRGKTATIPPRPWPSIVPTRTQRAQDGDWVVFLKVAGATDKMFRRGEVVRETSEEGGAREALVVEVTSGSVTCEYLAERRLFYSFPLIPCKLTKPSPEGLVVYVETDQGLKPFRTGDKFLEAELIEALPQQATWKYRDETRTFPTLAYPDLACTGTTKMSGVWFAYFDGENQGYRAGQTVRGARIVDIQQGAVKVTFAGIQSEVPASYQTDRR